MSASDWFFDVPASERWTDDQRWADKHFGPEPLDRGIIRVVRILIESGIETAQSCEGPEGLEPRNAGGHSYRHPTIDVTHQPWGALEACNQFGIRVDHISEVYGIRDGRPVEHLWRVELNSRALTELRIGWYGDCSDYPPRVTGIDDVVRGGAVEAMA